MPRNKIRLRRARRSRFARVRKSDDMNSYLTKEQTDLNGTGAGATITLGGTGNSVFTQTAHSRLAGQGPFVLTAATTLPAGYTAGELLWVLNVIDANTFTMCTARRSKVAKTFTNTGVGALTLTKASSKKAIFELLKQRKPQTISASTDVDNL